MSIFLVFSITFLLGSELIYWEVNCK